MKEQLLHYIWKFKKFDHIDLRLADGRKLIIQNYGFYNSNESGPDFLNAQISIDNISWHGQIEMHIKSSDWFNHQHHKDPNYNNVILHVVWENDMDVEIGGEHIPVLELKKRLAPSILANYKNLKCQTNQIPCYKLIKSLHYSYLQQMVDTSIIDRLQRKTKSFEEQDESQILFSLLSQTIGGNVNKHSFSYISEKLPYHFLNHMTNDQRLFAFSAFKEVLTAKESQKKIQVPLFKKKGMYPASQPEIRLNQLASLTPIIQKLSEMINLTENELIFSFRKLVQHLDNSLSFSMQNKLLINVVVPYLFWIGKNQSFFIEKAFNILYKLPPEKNNITRKMEEIGFLNKNSYDSQAILEIYTQFCSFKKCLSCSIGTKIIQS